MESIDLTQATPLAIIFIFFIREVFAYLKVKKNGGTGLNGKILGELQAMNKNHLHALEKAVTDGNRDLTKAINDGNMKIVEALGEIKGKLR